MNPAPTDAEVRNGHAGDASGYVWVLNPDAEREIGAVHSYAVRAAFVERIAALWPLFEKLTLGEPAMFSHEPPRPTASSGQTPLRALLWCPTTQAANAARRSGFTVPVHPSMDVLRRVHNKRFISEALAPWVLPGRAFVETEQAWQELRARTRGPLRLKRPFGYAGKGQRIWPEQGSRDDLRWLSDSLRQGGFLAEPHVVPSQELSLHGFVDAGGCLLGDPCLLTTDARGVPLDVRAAGPQELHASPTALAAVGSAAASALADAGYFGPFGIDLLVVGQTPQLIDLNPRFSLGWSIGLGSRRAGALQRALDPAAY